MDQTAIVTIATLVLTGIGTGIFYSVSFVGSTIKELASAHLSKLNSFLDKMEESLTHFGETLDKISTKIAENESRITKIEDKLTSISSKLEMEHKNVQ